MKSITITINTENAAFDPHPDKEVVRILTRLARQIEIGNRLDVLWDNNGNKVGTVEVTE